MTDLYFRFIQFSLGLYEGTEFLDGTELMGFDWGAFYEFAKEQTLIGVVFEGGRNCLRRLRHICNC